MRIKFIEIQGLFGVFNHQIDLNLQDRITIIHGPNGYGKTSIMQLLHSLFGSNSYYLFKIPFHSMNIEFVDDETLTIHKDMEKSSLSIHYKNQQIELNPPSIDKEIEYQLSYIDREIPGLVRISKDHWRYEPGQEYLNFDQVCERFGDIFPPLKHIYQQVYPDWLKQLRSKMDIRFIQSQRLVSPAPLARGNQNSLIPSIARLSQNLSKIISSRLAEYGALSQKLDHTFPVRLLDQIQQQNDKPPENSLHEKFEQLADAQDRLVHVGLLSPQSKQELALPSQMDPSTRIVLTLYLGDVKQKLEILVPLANKLELFKSIINELFIYKRLEIDKDKGFLFYGSKDDEIALTDLSSGEQHQVILFYELLFQTQPQALVLIDEPELSLHVIWQEIFLKQLEQVAGIAQLDMVLATHSPQVINDRWDLTVELTGPGE